MIRETVAERSYKCPICGRSFDRIENAEGWCAYCNEASPLGPHVEVRQRAKGEQIEVVRSPILDIPETRTTDLRNAQRLINLHGKDLRYVSASRKWLHWNGKYWEEPSPAKMVKLASEAVMRIYREASEEEDVTTRKLLADWAKTSESEQRLRAMIAIGPSVPLPSNLGATVEVAPDQLDSDPYLLNVGNGSVDLHTGKLQPHRREDLITRLIPISYDPGAWLPLWDRFLNDVTGGDTELREFLQRAAGYSLTGSTQEEKLFFVYGATATGKTTFTEALKSTFGPYAVTADFETFLARRNAGGPRNDIARLAGARLVMSVEVDEGKRLAEGLVKMLTGGDTVAARWLYQESFEFKSRFKLWLCANHAPKVRDDDEALWRRMYLCLHPDVLRIAHQEERGDIDKDV